jgi:hypothetical protein
MAAFNNSATLSAATNTTLRTIGAGKEASFSVTFCNRTAGVSLVSLAPVTSFDNPASSDYFLYEYPIAANSMIQITGLVATSGQKIVARSSQIGVSVSVYGFEE